MEILSTDPEIGLGLLLAHPIISERFAEQIQKMSRMAQEKLLQGEALPDTQDYRRLTFYTYLPVALDVAKDLTENNLEEEASYKELLSEYWQASSTVIAQSCERLAEIEDARISPFELHGIMVRQYIEEYGEYSSFATASRVT